MTVTTRAARSRVDEDTSPAARLVDEIRAMGDEAVRPAVATKRSLSCEERAAAAAPERLAWAQEQAARLRASL
jgi:hypothetical protein